jgi:hypothetical protein
VSCTKITTALAPAFLASGIARKAASIESWDPSVATSILVNMLSSFLK